MMDKPLQPIRGGSLQASSRDWWNSNPMSYDWHGTNPALEGTPEFFDETDRRFFSSSPQYRGLRPFEQCIPFDQLIGKRVLEVGCGLGSHTQLLAEAGCEITAIDITKRAVNLTKRRLTLRALSADVRQMDAEHMNFADAEFDFVWSWGVIHHSAHTDQIIREVSRVLKPGGQFRFMVYHRRAFDAYVKIVRGVLTGKLLRGMSTADMRDYYTDGYIARYYTRHELTQLINANGLKTESTSLLGQTSELLPLPGSGVIGRFKYALLPKLPAGLTERVLRSVGSFLFAVATKPEVIE